MREEKVEGDKTKVYGMLKTVAKINTELFHQIHITRTRDDSMKLADQFTTD